MRYDIMFIDGFWVVKKLSYTAPPTIVFRCIAMGDAFKWVADHK